MPIPPENRNIEVYPLNGIDTPLPDFFNDPLEEIRQWADEALPEEIRQNVLEGILKIRKQEEK